MSVNKPFGNSLNRTKDQHNEIPILQDRYEGVERNPATASPGSTAAIPPTGERRSPRFSPDKKNNPFLPYETLEKLAAERVQFQQQLAEFEHHFNLKQVTLKKPVTFTFKEQRKPVGKKPEASAARDLKTESIRDLVRSVTEMVMAEYAPEIEMEVFRRVQTKLLGSPIRFTVREKQD
jgi:hypothetical protein